MDDRVHSLRVLAEGFAYDTEEKKYRLRQLDDLISQGLAFVSNKYLSTWAGRSWTVRVVALTEEGVMAARPVLRKPRRSVA